jgi:hypothetical protein
VIIYLYFAHWLTYVFHHTTPHHTTTAVQASVAAALETAESVEGGAATAEELRELLDQASDADDAIKAIKEQVGAGEGWVFSGYRPMEALGLLGEMAAWLRYVDVYVCGMWNEPFTPTDPDHPKQQQRPRALRAP